MTFEYWFMFPVSVVVAGIAMASGVEGATFFAPIFILGLGFPPEVAIGIGLITEVFGFASGLFAYIKKRLIDYKLGRSLLRVSIPNVHKREFAKRKAETCLVSADGEKICYTACNKADGMMTAGIGGLFMGLISTGLGEMNGYFLQRQFSMLLFLPCRAYS